MKMSLLESVVINPDQVEAYVKQLANVVRFQEGKDWMYKRVRFLILNSDDKYLRRAMDREITVNSPNYVKAAIERNEAVYAFDDINVANLNELSNEVHIVADYLNGLYQQASQQVNDSNPVAKAEKALAIKTLSKITKVTWQQAIDAADKWAQSAVKRASKLSKHGGDIIKQWDDGYYAISFNDKETMRRDGAQLQNCLAQGMYWDQVVAGRQIVVAIRKPNDEAVVGMRFSVDGKTIHECKGKNNKPITQNYVPYVVDLLRSFGTSNENYDLKNAGIEFDARTHSYGTFKDIATLVYDRDGYKIWETDARGIVDYKNRGVADYTLAGQDISSINFEENVNPITILRLIGRGAKPHVMDNLKRQGIVIFYKDGKWGSLADIAEYIMDLEDQKIYRIAGDNNKFYGGTIYIENDNHSVSELVYDSGLVQGELPSSLMHRLSEKSIVTMLDAVGLHLANMAETPLLNYGMAYSPEIKKHIPYGQGKKIKAYNDVVIYQIPGRNCYFIDDVEGDNGQSEHFTAPYILTDSKGMYMAGGLESSDRRHVSFVGYLVDKKKLKGNHAKGYQLDFEHFGVAEMGQSANQLYFDPDTVIENFAKMPSGFRVFTPTYLSEDSGRYISSAYEKKILNDDQLFEIVKLMTPDPKEYFRIQEVNRINIHKEPIVQCTIKLADGLISAFEYIVVPDKISKHINKVKEAIEEATMAEIKKRDKKEAVIYENKSTWPYEDFREYILDHNAKATHRAKSKAEEILNNKDVSVDDKFAALRAKQKLKR